MAKSTARQRLRNEINAGSMADIAFLLLIFFLVTTTIVEDTGVKVRLPPWTDEPSLITEMRSRNVFSVLVNADNELLVRGEPIQIDGLKDYAKEFILNPSLKSEFAQKPTKAIISLQNDRATSYHMYLAVYNELKAAYNELWNESAHRRYGLPYSEEMPFAMRKAIRAEIPLVISEADPFHINEMDE